MSRAFPSIAAVLLFFMATSGLWGQSFYAALYGAYALSADAQNLPGFNHVQLRGSVRHEEQIKLSYGQGFQAGVRFAYRFNPYLAVELELNYLQSAEFVAEQSLDGFTNDFPVQGDLQQITSAQMGRIIPALRLSPGYLRFNPYLRTGLVLGWGQLNFSYRDESPGRIAVNNWEYTGGMAWGFNTALGLEYALKERLSIFAEASLISLSYAPQRGEMVAATNNGVDELDSYPPHFREREFVSSYRRGPESSSEELSKTLRTFYPFSSLALNLGLAVKLGP